MAFFIHPNQFLVFFRDPDASFTPERMKKILVADGVTVEGESEPFTLRWQGGKTLHASIIRGEVAAILASRLMGRKRKHRAVAECCDAYVEVKFESLDEMLDDVNTLIVVQAALQQATGGLLYLSWNQTFTEPNE